MNELLLEDLMDLVDSSKREALLNLQKELSLRSDLKIKAYVEGYSFNTFLEYFFKYSNLESLLLDALHSEKKADWLKKVTENNLVYFLVYDPIWKSRKPNIDVRIDLVFIGKEEKPVLEINVS